MHEDSCFATVARFLNVDHEIEYKSSHACGITPWDGGGISISLPGEGEWWTDCWQT